MNNLKKLFFSNNANKFLSSLIAIITGLLFGLILLLLVNPSEAFPAFMTILGAGFRSVRNVGDILYYAGPLCITGLSVAFAFKTGLFNIGASGQFFVGGFAAIFIGVHFGDVFGNATWLLGLIVGAVFGALWALIPGLLKAYKNVNEVVSTIMMNYIGLYMVLYLIKETTFNKLTNTSLAPMQTSLLPYFGLDKIFPGSKVQGTIVIAIILTILIYIILNKTVFGYNLKVVGHNKDAAKYAGINEKKSIVYSMLIAGALAGIAGACVYLSRTGDYIKIVDILPTYGFDGIAVALLGQSSAIGTFLSSIFFGLLKVGGDLMQLFSFSKEIIDIISSSIIYFSALSLMFNKIIKLVKDKIDKGGIN